MHNHRHSRENGNPGAWTGRVQLEIADSPHPLGPPYPGFARSPKAAIQSGAIGKTETRRLCTIPSSVPILLALTFALGFVFLACSGTPRPHHPDSRPIRHRPHHPRLHRSGRRDNRVVFALIQPGSGALKDAQVEVQTSSCPVLHRTRPSKLPQPHSTPGPVDCGGLSRKPNLRPRGRLGTGHNSHPPRGGQPERGRKNRC